MKEKDKKNLSDAEIIVFILSCQENSEYFALLYNKYYRKVLDKCYSFVKNRQIASELTEDIFSKCYEKLSGYKNISSFSSWLYAIAYNHCIDYLRVKKKLHYPDWNRENELPEIIDEEDESAENIDYDKLLNILEIIHPEEKALILMKYQDNLSLRHIGETLRISEDAAKMRLKRARTRVLMLYREIYWNK